MGVAIGIAVVSVVLVGVIGDAVGIVVASVVIVDGTVVFDAAEEDVGVEGVVGPDFGVAFAVAFAARFRAIRQPLDRVCGKSVFVPKRQRGHDHSVCVMVVFIVLQWFRKFLKSATMCLTMFFGYNAARAVLVTTSPFAAPCSRPCGLPH